MSVAAACVADYRGLAQRRLPRMLFDYIDGGAYAENTLAANVAALRSIGLRQRVLRDVSQLDMGVTVLGQALAMPVVLAPVGLAGMFARRAEVAAARAAARAGVRFCESTVSICSLEEVAAATDVPPWFQLYVMRDRRYAETLMARARAVGCPVLVLTVDLPVVGARYRDFRNGMTASSPVGKAFARTWDIARHPRWAYEVALRGRPLTFGNLTAAVPGGRSPASFKRWIDAQFDPSVTWADLSWVRANWAGKLVIKGILDVADARRAAEEGVDGIVVSNHGGRQLDDVPATATAIGAIADAVGEQLEVLVDGGIRSGLDVAKMLALGARACLIGRAWAYSVAAGGEQGVSHALATIREELRVAMALTGITRATAFGRGAVEHRTVC